MFNCVKISLDYLHTKGFAYVDLHPGNLLIVKNPDAAETVYLIDFESMVPLNEKCDSLICRPEFRTVFDDKTPTKKTDYLGLILLIAWIFNFKKFRKNVPVSLKLNIDEDSQSENLQANVDSKSHSTDQSPLDAKIKKSLLENLPKELKSMEEKELTNKDFEFFKQNLLITQ